MKYLHIVIVDTMIDGLYSVINLHSTDCWSGKEWDEMTKEERKEWGFIAMRNHHKQHFNYLMADREAKGINAIDTVEVLLCMLNDGEFETMTLDVADSFNLQYLIDIGFATDHLTADDFCEMYAAVTDNCKSILEYVTTYTKPVIVGATATTTINTVTGKTN